jgi:hypothetical protein
MNAVSMASAKMTTFAITRKWRTSEGNMSGRYEIVVRPHGQDTEMVLCTCNSNPEAIVEATKQKALRVSPDGIPGGPRKIMIPKYEHVYFRERAVDTEMENKS